MGGGIRVLEIDEEKPLVEEVPSIFGELLVPHVDKVIVEPDGLVKVSVFLPQNGQVPLESFHVERVHRSKDEVEVRSSHRGRPAHEVHILEKIEHGVRTADD
jgi:hypothetical protein